MMKTITLPFRVFMMMWQIANRRKKINGKAPYDENEYKKEVGVKALWGEKGFTTNESTGIRPTLEVNGIWGGYTGEGAKTVLPCKATCKNFCTTGT